MLDANPDRTVPNFYSVSRLRFLIKTSQFVIVLPQYRFNFATVIKDCVDAKDAVSTFANSIPDAAPKRVPRSLI